MSLLQDWLLVLTIACALAALLGGVEVLLCWWQRRSAFRGLPAPDTPALRAHRARDAYDHNSRAYIGLR